jgi:hypothetical protein
VVPFRENRITYVRENGGRVVDCQEVRRRELVRRPSLIRTNSEIFSAFAPAAKKIAGHRDECRDGLLFPPEQVVRCTLSERISSRIFHSPAYLTLGWVQIA